MTNLFRIRANDTKPYLSKHRCFIIKTYMVCEQNTYVVKTEESGLVPSVFKKNRKSLYYIIFIYKYFLLY